MTLYVKSFDGFLNESTLNDVEKQINSWNKKYSQSFKFENDKAKVLQDIRADKKESAKEGLKSLANLLITNHKVSIIIEAHTSSPQASSKWDNSNEKLSQARAANIKNYLVQLGVNEEQLAAKGLAFTKPAEGADDDTTDSEDGLSAKQKQAKNRRATIRIDYEKIKTTPKEVLDIDDPDIEIDDPISFPDLTKEVYSLRADFNSYTIQLASTPHIGVNIEPMEKINKYSIISPNCGIAQNITRRKAQIEQLEQEVKMLKKEDEIRRANIKIKRMKNSLAKPLGARYKKAAEIGIEIQTVKDISVEISNMKPQIINDNLPKKGSDLDKDILKIVDFIKKNKDISITLIGQSEVKNEKYRRDLALARAYYIKLVLIHYESSIQSNMITIKADTSRAAMAIKVKAAN